MSAELHTGDGAARSAPPPETGPDTVPDARDRPHVSGDLPTVLQSGPMFRRTVAGYDRFQVDTYVRWAEDELATADRQHEDLLAAHVRTRTELDEARDLLAHSRGGGEFLQVSRRVGSMLAAAADEAEAMRAEAENRRSVAHAQAEVVTAAAGRVLADAETEAARLLREAAAEAAGLAAEAARVLGQAERTRRDAGTEAEQRLEQARAGEQRAAERGERILQQARADAAAARLDARSEVVRMLDTAREQRRRADDEAAAVRERLDGVAAARRAGLLAEVAELEQRRDALRAELESAPVPVVPSPSPRHLDARAHLERIQERLGWQGTGRSAVAAVNGRHDGRTGGRRR